MKESKETAKDENKESMEEQQSEKEKGTEENSPHIISEEFQKEVIDLCSEYEDSRPCLEYARDRFQQGLDDLRNREMEAKNKGKKGPKEFNTVGMPGY